MFSKDFQNKVEQKYNLSHSLITKPIHYKIPDFVYKTKRDTINLMKDRLEFDSDLLNLPKSKTFYTIRKEKNIYESLNRIERDKIDILINRAYDQINHNIRKYNECIDHEKDLKLKYLPMITKETIKDEILGKVDRYLSKDNKNTKENRRFDKEFIWSRNLMAVKRENEYKKMYRIKYIDVESEQGRKYGKSNFKRDFTIPSIIKLNHTKFLLNSKKCFSSRDNKKKNVNGNNEGVKTKRFLYWNEIEQKQMI